MFQCIQKVPVEDITCLQKCDGIVLTGFERRNFEENAAFARLMKKAKSNYQSLKGEGFISFQELRGRAICTLYIPISHTLNLMCFRIQME